MFWNGFGHWKHSSFSCGLSDPVALLLSLYDVLHYALSCVHILTNATLDICFLHDKEIHTFSRKYAVLNKAEFLALFENMGYWEKQGIIMCRITWFKV